MPQVHHVLKAQKDNEVCKKGEPYYWWKFRFGGKHFSLTPPKRSQLTQSDFLSTVYGIQESIDGLNASDADDLRSQVESITGDIDSLREETEGKLSNMPDSLQQGPTGELLQNRVDELSAWQDEISAVDLDTDLWDDEQTEVVRTEGESDDDFDARLATVRDDWLSERITEVQSTSYNGE